MKKTAVLGILVACFLLSQAGLVAEAQVDDSQDDSVVLTYDSYGGGYAATGQISGVGYTTEVYDATNGLPTSDAMAILGAENGYMWIGGYAGVICYDGSNFERLDTSDGLTSARGFLEDSQGRIWIGTNDNGVVVIDQNGRTHITYKDGLPSSSIRVFEEDASGNVFIGTTTGLCYADAELKIHKMDGYDFSDERILRLDKDGNGRIYGQTSSGVIFAIDDNFILEMYTSEQLGLDQIETIMCDPLFNGKLYIGTRTGKVYYGTFGEGIDNLKLICEGELSEVHWINYDCGRVWISSTTQAGYLDSREEFHLLEDIPVNSGIEMITSDYQGNIWMASSTQGVMKLVTNNFRDVTGKAGVEPVVSNAVCLHNASLYIGTDSGLIILANKTNIVENSLTEYLQGTRIRCIKEDEDNNLWIATYTNDLGLVCYTKFGDIKSYTVEDGMPHNSIRSVSFSKNGDVLAGTNGGLAVIREGQVVRTVGIDDNISNTVFLTVEESLDGTILAGTDGGGMYEITSNNVMRFGLDDGLTSEVVLRIIPDEGRNIVWIVTSNSIELIKNGTIRQVTSFPYNNNYDICFDDNDNAWILSSYGVYSVNVDDLINDSITDYNLYTIENGLPYAITANSYSAKDKDGNLYIPGREGVVSLNINNYVEGSQKIFTDLQSVYCDNERIVADENGVFTIPSSKGRVLIKASVMDYTMLNPTVHVYLEGADDSGITVLRSNLTELEYTNLPYGDYLLHVQILDKNTGEAIQDDSFEITKSARLTELLIFRAMLFVLTGLAAGLIVWKIMKSTVIARQFEEIRKAKEEAEGANSAKSRFLANMSHEIRTPINTIMGMNEMIMREDATGVPKSYFMSMINYALDIKNATESLLGLINDLLDISKIESGKMHLVEQEYDVATMLRSIVSMIRVRSTEKELTFDVVIDDMLPKRLYGDDGKIKQIVLNILTNAVKYTEIGGFVLTVSMDSRENDDASLRFSVKDTGIGVKEEDLDKLFTAYERLDEERNSGIQGTGLGLDISKKFSELMGGQLWCESVYGEGSEFIFTVNQRIVDATPMGAFIEKEESEAKGPYVPKFIAPDADILVVDDNTMNLSVMKGLLKATRVFVTTSTSGEDAIEKIKDNHFDVVLMDHMMPGMDGVEAVAKIREFDKELPVYALTANSTAGAEWYKSKGFNGYLPKPVDSETLESTIMKHLPESMMEIPKEATGEAELTEIPDAMQWIYKTDGINVEEGIKNSGGIGNYIFALQLFLDTLDDNAKVISDAYSSDNIRLYTIKVHSLKSSARIIGATELSTLAEDLENAGNSNDLGFIRDNNARLLTLYEDFKVKLERINQSLGNDEDKEAISDGELADAYSALKDCIPQMDYDAVEMILEQLSEYKLPEEDAGKMDSIRKMLKSFDWDGMEELIASC